MSSIKTKIIRGFNTRAGYLVAALALFVGSVVPVTLASADAVTDRSLVLNTTAADASGVEYTVNFTPTSAAAAVVVEFCSNSPNIEDTCTAPGGLTVAGVTTPAAFSANFDKSVANKVSGDMSLTGGTPASIVLAGVHNPTNAGPLYARIVTYAASGNVSNYPSVASGSGYVDNGSVVASITPTVGVTGAVLETLTFCVAKAVIKPGCVDANLDLPTLALGEGSPKALSAGAVSTGDLYSQLSSNAAKGVVVNLKINNTCGGLKRSNVATCDIAPVIDTNGISDGQAKFGVRVAADTARDTLLNDDQNGGTPGTVSGNTITPTGNYATNYFIDWVSGNATGVGSVYGSPLFQTTGAPSTGSQPLTNRNVKLTFGASISNATPAGNYAADMSLIATGTF